MMDQQENSTNMQLPLEEQAIQTLTKPWTDTPAKTLGSNSKDVINAKLKRINDPKVKDPAIFTDPTDRKAATLARAQRIIAGKKFQDLPESIDTKSTMVGTNIKGLVEKGNLPIWNRPRIQNDDGSYSSEYSTSFEDEQGREVLVPTVVNGKFLTSDGKKPKEGSNEEKEMFKAAWQHYLKTGENLGKFDNYKDADAYSEILHNRGTQATKNQVLADYYRKRVVPTYRDLGYAIPDQARWIQGIQSKNLNIKPEDFYESNSLIDHTRRISATTISSGVDLFSHIAVAGINLGQAASRQYLNLDKFFQAHHLSLGPEATEQEKKDYKNSWDQDLKEQIQKRSSQVINDLGFWMDINPSKSWTRYIDTFVGENLIQLPFYKAIGIPLKAAGVALESTAVGNLTKTLNYTKGGQFVANRLKDGAEALIASVVQGQSKEDVADNILGFWAIGSVADGATIAGSSLIKRFTAKTVAMGGTPLQEAVTQQAMHEMDSIKGEVVNPHPDISVDYPSRPKDFWFSATNPKTGGVNKFNVSTEQEIQRWIQHFEGHGYIDVKYGKIAKTTEESKKEWDNWRNEAVEEIKGSGDPVKTTLVTAEKITLSSLGKEKYGKAWNQLSQAQRALIKQDRDKLTSQAVQEVVYHNPDIAKSAATVSVINDEKLNSKLAKKNLEFYQKFGIKIPDAVHEAELDHTAKTTGINNIDNATKKVAKASKEVSTANTAKVNEAKSENPRQYASFKIDSLAYFKNIKSSFDEAKSKVNWEKDLQELSDEDLIKDLKEHSPNLKFESDRNAILWAYNYAKNLPKPFLSRIEDLLQDRLGNDPRVWARQAKELENHMENLAYSGYLSSEGNIFRSTNLEGRPTKWQRELSREYIQQERDEYYAAMAPYRKFHSQEVRSGYELLESLQRARTAAIYDQEPNKVKLLSQKIRTLASEKVTQLR
jgi:hypothetical protein